MAYQRGLHAQDLKRVLKKAGLDGRDTMFLFSDSQIIQEGFLEDLNNILNAGENCNHNKQSEWMLMQTPSNHAHAPACMHA